MDRREAVRNMAFLMGGAISVTTMGALMESCNRTSPGTGGAVTNIFNNNQQALVTQIADMIIPTTDTPGARAAGVGPFITMMITECYPEDAQKAFLKGLDDVEDRARKKYSKTFMEIDGNGQTAVLKEVAGNTSKLRSEEKKGSEKETPANIDAVNKAAKKKSTPYFFQMIRDLTLLGYFTSEIGASKALAYVPVPGRYDGCVDYKKGQKAWAI